MTALAAWQAHFAAALEHEQGEAAFGALLAAQGAITPAQGLDTYRNNTRGARLRALEAIYPVCRQVLGADCFHAVAARWVRQTPSTDGDLNRAGEGLPDLFTGLVAQQVEYATLPWLPDLARLEWRLHQAYYRPDPTRLDLQVLETAREPGRLVPRLVPTLELLRSDWPVLRIWEDHQPGGEPGPLTEAAGPWHLVIHRPEFRPQAELVTTELYRLLEACRNGWDLDRLSHDPALDASLLQQLIARGWLVGFAESSGGV